MDGSDREDFASFYTQHAPFVRRALTRRGVRDADLDDVAQEAFVAAHRQLPAFEDRSSLRTWLTAIAWRTAANYHRRSHHHGALELDDAPSLTELDASGAFEHEDFPGACEALEPELRDLILLHDVGGLSISELSSLTGRARATIRLHLKQARALVARGPSPSANAAKQPPMLVPLGSAKRSSEPPHFRILPNKQVCFSRVDDVLIHVWRGPTPAEYLKLFGESMEEMLEVYPESFRFLNVIESSSTPPGRDGRELSGELARRFGHRVRAASYSLESSTLMRIAAPILNSYFALVRTSINIRFFNAIGPATQWLAPYGATEQAALLDHVAAMRARLDQAHRD